MEKNGVSRAWDGTLLGEMAGEGVLEQEVGGGRSRRGSFWEGA